MSLKVVKEAKVTNSINLNLSQADLIDLYIQENTERIIAKHALLLERYKAIKLSSLDVSGIKHNITAIKDGKLSIDSYPDKTIDTISYKQLFYSIKNWKNDVSLENLFEYKKIEITDTKFEFYAEKIRRIILSADHESYSNRKPSESIIKQFDVLVKNNIKADKKYYQQRDEIFQEAYELWQEYQQFANEKAIKAKFTKKTLNQTEEGKLILEMVSNLNNTPLLGK